MPALSLAGASHRALISLFLITVTGTHAAPLSLLNRETRLNYSGRIAISGNTLVVDGAIYVRREFGWAIQQVIAGSGDLLLDGDTLLFGTKIYVRNGSTWTLQHVLPLELANRLGSFNGPASALSGDSIAIGLPYGWDGGTNAYAHGAVYVFAREDATWIRQAVIEPLDPSPGMRFGLSVALSADTLVIGAPGSWEQLPAVYVYLRQGTNWVQQAKLTDNSGLSSPGKTMFGSSVAIASDGIAVGDPAINGYQGAISLFRRVQTRTGPHWGLRETIAGVSSNSWFGSVLSMSEAGLLAGGERHGTLRLFDRDDTAWIERSLTAVTNGYVVGPEAALGVEALVLNAPWMRAAFVYENEPRGWNNRNVGDTGVAGSMAVDHRVSISGGGADIGGTNDAFHYAYRTWSGDGTFIARITSIDASDGWARAGIMFRSSLEPDAANAFLLFRTAGQAGFQARTARGHDTSHTDGGWWATPYWLKIIRTGQRFSGYESREGTRWTLVASTNIAMPDDILVGLAVTSHRYGVSCNAVFDHVSIAPWPGVPNAPSHFTAISIGPDLLRFAWKDNSHNEEYFQLESSTDNQRFYSFASVAANATNYWTRSEATATYYRMRGLSPDGDSDYSDVVSVLPPAGGGLVAPWRSLNIGGGAGRAYSADGMFAITGQGYVLYGTEDKFNHVYQPFAGNGEIVAFLEHGLNPAFHVGLMFRQSLDASSAFASAFGATLVSRAGTGSFAIRAASPTPFGGWVRLTRSNNLFRAYTSWDGINWIAGEARSIPGMTDPLLVGMAVTTDTMVLSNVRVSRYGPAATPPLLGQPIRHPDGTIQFLITGEPGFTYGFEASTDLRRWNWIMTELNTTGRISFVDAAAPFHTQRFYRIVVVQ